MIQLRWWVILSQVLAPMILITAFPPSKRWLIVILLIPAVFCWFLTRSSRAEWPFHLIFGLSLMLAAVGFTLGGTRFLLLAASVFSLAAWDLSRFNTNLEGDPAHPLAVKATRKHFGPLGGVCAVSLLVVLAGSQLKLDLSFAFVLVLAVVTGLAIASLSGTSGKPDRKIEP